MHKDLNKRTEYFRQYRKTHKDLMLKHSRKYETAHKNEIADRKLQSKYGLTLEQFNQMSLNQQNKCLICTEIKRLSVDHCHLTNKVRGLLCTECNLAIGLLKDNMNTLHRAMNYLATKL